MASGCWSLQFINTKWKLKTCNIRKNFSWLKDETQFKVIYEQEHQGWLAEMNTTGGLNRLYLHFWRGGFSVVIRLYPACNMFTSCFDLFFWLQHPRMLISVTSPSQIFPHKYLQLWIACRSIILRARSAVCSLLYSHLKLSLVPGGNEEFSANDLRFDGSRYTKEKKKT